MLEQSFICFRDKELVWNFNHFFQCLSFNEIMSKFIYEDSDMKLSLQGTSVSTAIMLLYIV